MRCARDPTQLACARCTRLKYTCTTQRAVQPRGRPSSLARPPDRAPGELVWISNQGPSFTPLRSALSGQNRPSDDALLASMSSAEHFLSYFILGPHFATRFQSAVEAPLAAHPNLLREGCLACAGAVFQARTHKSGFDNINFAHSAVGLRKLRSAAETNGDVGAFVALGLALATFDLITSGAATRTITRFTLSYICTSSQSTELIQEPRLESNILCLVFMDTVECLLRCELPVVQYQVRDPTLVHRLHGLCTPLLPIMYSVCRLAFDSRSRGLSPRHFNPALFDHLSAFLTSWQPQPPINFEATFSSQEVTCLLTQARVFRRAVSLALHRLEHSFGVEDEFASLLSIEILAEYAACASIVDDEAGWLPPTLFPWMMAAFEVTAQAVREKLLRMELPKSREILGLPTAKMKECVRFVWEKRDAGHHALLFDLLEQAPICLVPL